MEHFTTIDRCRISGSKKLVTVLDLGDQALTGVFPRTCDALSVSGPLQLTWCPDSGAVQLGHSYNLNEMYGQNYGYRSGLNNSMVAHLAQKVHLLEKMTSLSPGATVLDVGSNDATLLKSYTVQGLHRVGVDPTASKFRAFYPDDILVIADFFSADSVRRAGARRAQIVTSVAMFYDLEDPVAFARDVESVLAPGGIWHFEQSYMPSMLRLNSYDTICQEHLHYYSLGIIQRILDQADLKMIDVKMNGTNGGSFAVTAVRRSDRRNASQAVIEWLLAQENSMGLDTPRPYRDFEERVYRHRRDLTALLKTLAADGKRVLGYGASTKGNVILQFCGITTNEIAAIAEVNEDKFGCFTPGTHIPIISEAEARLMKPDYFLVLPWHFKDSIVKREAAFLAGGGSLILPFPEIEIV